MLVSTLNSRVYLRLKLLVLLFPVTWNVYSTSLEPVTSPLYFINNIIGKAHKESPIDTLLILKDGTDLMCPLNDFNSVTLPTLRMDKSTTLPLRKVFSKEVLILLCLSQSSDSISISSLAESLNGMREARIIIWLDSQLTTLEELHRMIIEQASTYNFLNLLVLHSPSSDDNGLLNAFKLQPFPSATLKRIPDLNNSQLFLPKIYLNFYGKTAVVLPDLFAPDSFLARDLKTSTFKYYGQYERMIIEFAKKRNITLKFWRPVHEGEIVEISELLNLTFDGKLDLPMRTVVHWQPATKVTVEHSVVYQIISHFVLVPCAEVVSIGDVYKNLRAYSKIVLVAYFMFAILETFFVAATYHLIQNRYRFSYSTLFINLQTFCGVLGLPQRLNRNRSTLSLQQLILVMSLFGMILTCLFNANLSTLLIKQPQQKQIQNFEELRASGMPVIAGLGTYSLNKSGAFGNFAQNKLPKLQAMKTTQLQDLIKSLNTSYCYFVADKIWKPYRMYQKTYKINALCESPGLVIGAGLFASGLLKNNSIYRLALNEFIQSFHSHGLSLHLEVSAGHKMMAAIHVLVSDRVSVNSREYSKLSLSFDDLMWLWMLIGFGYCVAGVVFVAELIVASFSRKKRNYIINV